MRRTLVLMVLAAVAWPAVGCGDDGGAGSDEDLDRLVSALEEAEQTPMRGRLSLRADTAKEGRIRMQGTFEMDGVRGRMSARYVQDGQTIDMELIQHEDVAWFRMPRLYELLPPGKRWIRTTDPEILGSSTLTPDEFGEMLEGAGEVETLGRERMLGVEATHLRGTVDLRKLAEGTDAAGAEKFLSNLGDSEAPLPMDIWIGPDGRPVRYRVEVELPRPGGGRPQFAVFDCRVEEYEVPVDDDRPPAAQVTDDSVLQ
jgi:hypothetical protein